MNIKKIVKKTNMKAQNTHNGCMFNNVRDILIITFIDDKELILDTAAERNVENNYMKYHESDTSETIVIFEDILYN